MASTAAATLAAPVSPGRPAPGRRFRRRWTGAFVVGELVGFLPPALTGAALARAGAADPVLVAGLTAAGLLEGYALGSAQARVLRPFAPAVDRRAWVLATTAGAGFAWLGGMGGSAVLGAGLAPVALVVAALVPVWLAGLLGMGFGQWLVLRRTVPSAGRWVWASALAWLLGVPIPVAALSLAPDGWPACAHVVVGVIGAVGMGVTVGALTGRTLERLLGAGRGARPLPRRPCG